MTIMTNEEAAATAKTGATRRQTVTVANPTPPTNWGCVGKTPPMPPPEIPSVRQEMEEGDPRKFAPATAETEPEGAGTEVFDILTGSVATCGVWTARPNTVDPTTEDPPDWIEMTVTSITPAEGTIDAPAFPLTVVGTGFTPDTQIMLHGNIEPTEYVSDTELRTIVRSVPGRVAGVYPVTVMCGDQTVPVQSFTFTEAL